MFVCGCVVWERKREKIAWVLLLGSPKPNIFHLQMLLWKRDRYVTHLLRKNETLGVTWIQGGSTVSKKIIIYATLSHRTNLHAYHHESKEKDSKIKTMQSQPSFFCSNKLFKNSPLWRGWGCLDRVLMKKEMKNLEKRKWKGEFLKTKWESLI